MRKTLHQVHCTWFGAEVELVKWFAPGSRGLCKLESKVKRLGWPWLLKDPLDGGEGCLVLFCTGRLILRLSWNLWEQCVCVLLNCAWLFAISWTVAHQGPLSMGFSGQEYWSGLPFPSPEREHLLCDHNIFFLFRKRSFIEEVIFITHIHGDNLVATRIQSRKR